MSETYLNSSITDDDDSLQIPGYDLIRSDYPSNNKRGDVTIYYKNFLLLKLIDVNYLSESILFELQIVQTFCSKTLLVFIGHLVKQLTILIHFLII